MGKERNINFDAMMRFLHEVSPKIWEQISGECEETIGGNFLYKGYYLMNNGALVNPPRILIVASLKLPENKKVTDYRAVDALVKSSARGASEEGCTLYVDVRTKHPLMSILDRDEVFGTDPEIPHGMDYTITADEEDFFN